MIGRLFWGPLMPDALALSFAVGLSVGSIDANRRLKSPTARALLTSLIFSVILFLVAKQLTGRTWPTKFLEIIMLLAVSAILGCLAASIFAAAAVVGARAGKKLSNRPAHVRRWYTALVFLVTIGVILFHGVLVRLSVQRATTDLTLADGLVKLNLVALPESAIRIPLLSRDYRPRLTGFRIDLKDGNLTVLLDPSGGLQDAMLFLASPGSDSISKARFLELSKRYKVNESLTATVTQEAPAWWSAQSGPYSVTLSNSYPPSDD